MNKRKRIIKRIINREREGERKRNRKKDQRDRRLEEDEGNRIVIIIAGINADQIIGADADINIKLKNELQDIRRREIERKIKDDKWKEYEIHDYKPKKNKQRLNQSAVDIVDSFISNIVDGISKEILNEG
ncbi:MAG: hypothetical protein EZS28_037419, partial [Streblomastix strix]